MSIVLSQRPISSHGIHAVVCRRWPDGESRASMSADGSIVGVLGTCNYADVEMPSDSYCQCSVPATKTRSTWLGSKTDPPVLVAPR